MDESAFRTVVLVGRDPTSSILIVYVFFPSDFDLQSHLHL